ncbi:4'-phosphopantetheinyl transferase superfamily protein [Streptomyces sp. NPDC050388]|uniref:4'-phosphopantetheinyl transferase family protein n=1 Tax=Streptomyces sp. NPDC050388 TaxID=3155781 RepID=UPI00341A0699
MSTAVEPAPRTIRLRFCPNDGLAPGAAATLAAHWLDEHERKTAEQSLFERDRRQYLVSHVLVRRVLALECGRPESESVIRRSSRGRPFLRKPAGSRAAGLSRTSTSPTRADTTCWVWSATTASAWTSCSDRGDRGLGTIVQTFAPEEREWVAQVGPGRARDVRILRLWTLKEAYSKARGMGLGLSFDTFSFELAEDRGVLGFRPPDDDPAWRWRFMELEPAPGCRPPSPSWRTMARSWSWNCTVGFHGCGPHLAC